MASKTERAIINAAGLVQGIVLVTFPAASTIFTDKSQYGLSSTQYGDMFLPQVMLTVAASLLGAGLARRITTKRVYLLGLACSTISMVLLLASTLVNSNQAAAYPMLLVATAFLGAGFGLTVPALNTYTSVFNPDSVDRSVLTLNALLGLGTALAPVLVAMSPSRQSTANAVVCGPARSRAGPHTVFYGAKVTLGPDASPTLHGGKSWPTRQFPTRWAS